MSARKRFGEIQRRDPSRVAHARGRGGRKVAISCYVERILSGNRGAGLYRGLACWKGQKGTRALGKQAARCEYGSGRTTTRALKDAVKNILAETR